MCKDIYIFAGTSTINLNGSNKCKIRILGPSAVVTVNVTDNAYADIKTYNSAQVTVNLDSFGSAFIQCITDSDLTLNMLDDSFSNVVISDKATGTITMDNNAIARMKVFNDAVVDYTPNGTSEMFAQTYQKGVATNTAL
jgi:hypothetical protein